MLTCKGKLSLVVVERVDLFIKLPSFCAMTGDTADFKAGSVRMSGLPSKEKNAA